MRKFEQQGKFLKLKLEMSVVIFEQEKTLVSNLFNIDLTRWGKLAIRTFSAIPAMHAVIDLNRGILNGREKGKSRGVMTQ